ncbi:PH domain-containing protein [Actinomycetospora endophytica]|uniref:PH domain-containing protein n=1 Tax=Actinomycetospora endophytica TaxID=2291215 RepID=A0ABS8PFJ0_9PSEU|nr:PH domain-containing protein [Actinomycetospora endophytica]MCD2197031.1 PH domain-containing protein [Actinomycetospora endophytica]
MSEERGTTAVTTDEPDDASTERERTGSTEPRPAARPATFRAVHTVALVAVGFLALCLSPIAFQGGPWFLLFLIPLAVAVWVVRSRTRVDEAGLHVRGVVGTRSMPWSEVSGLRLPEKGWVRAVQTDGAELELRGVRIRDLGRVGEASGGRISAPTPAEAEAAAEHARELEAAKMRIAKLRADGVAEDEPAEEHADADAPSPEDEGTDVRGTERS